jgi:hypothetical protein
MKKRTPMQGLSKKNISQVSISKPGMVVHTCNLALGRWRQENYKFEVNFGCKARLCLKKPNQKS